jgi:hypothetical protein
VIQRVQLAEDCSAGIKAQPGSAISGWGFVVFPGGSRDMATQYHCLVQGRSVISQLGALILIKSAGSIAGQIGVPASLLALQRGQTGFRVGPRSHPLLGIGAFAATLPLFSECPAATGHADDAIVDFAYTGNLFF